MSNADRTTRHAAATGVSDEGAKASATLASALRGLRRRAKLQLTVQRLGTVVAVVLAAAMLVGLLDFLVRPPDELRWVFWVGLVTTLSVLLWRKVRPVVRFTPPLTEVALRIEKSPAGKAAGLAGVLAAGLELGAHSDEREDRSLAARTALDAMERFKALRGASVLNPRGLRSAMLALLLVAAPIVALSVFAPDAARVGWRRVWAPWTDAAWPRRTAVADANPMVAHPIGAALPLRAVLTKSPRLAENTTVRVMYRVRGARDGRVQRALMTYQNREAATPETSAAPGQTGALFERLLDTAALAPARSSASGDGAAGVTLEYWFETEDSRSPTARIALVEPPAVASAAVEIALPEYAAGLAAEGPASLLRGTIAAGTGRDARARIGPILAGSRVALEITLNKDLPTPAEDDREAWIARSLPGLSGIGDLDAVFTERVWRLTWTARENAVVRIDPRDRFGIRGMDEVVYRFDVTEDQRPLIAVIDPPQDEAVLATAVVDARAEARDDVGLALTALELQRARPPAESIGAPAEPLGDAAIVARASIGGAAATGTVSASNESDSGLVRAIAATTIEMAALDVRVGDEVWLTGLASDALMASEDAPPARSATRRLRIIGESDFIAQVLAELGAVREAAKRLEEIQANLMESLPRAAQDAAAAADQSARQRSVAERLEPVRDLIERLEQRIERNQPDDSAIAGLVADTADTAQQAQEAAARATESMEQLRTRAGTPEAPSVAEDAARAQREAQERLTELVEMLDRGQDTWAARRMIERLIADQKQLQMQTASAGESLQGRTADQLSENERRDLERLSQRQEELAQRTRAAIEELDTRAQQMEDIDKAQAESMRQAAQRARENEVPRQQSDAAQQIEQNQTTTAEEMQQQAIEGLQQALEEMERAEQRRDETLRRVLADIMQTLRRLIGQQETELTRLGAAIEGRPQENLDGAMIDLNRATMALADQAASEMEDAPRIGEQIDAAGTAQAGAIGSLRAQPADLNAADRDERIALTRLREALAEAERLAREAAQRDNERKRAELKKAYQEALEAQVALRGEAEPMIGRELSRRDRATVRRIGDQQEDLRRTMDELRSTTQDVAEARLFDYAHTRLDRLMAGAADPLRRGEAPATVSLDQEAAALVLASLIEALNQAQQQDDEFRDAAAGGGGGGGGGGQGAEQPLIPPIAELKLLRMLQQEAADRTRRVDDGGAAQADAELGRVATLQRELAEIARELLERMSQQPGGPMGPGEAPAPIEPDAPRGPDAPPEGDGAEGENPGAAGNEQNTDGQGG